MKKIPKNFLISKIIQPNTLFGIGVLQALLPYIYWIIFEKNPNYSYDVTFGPIIVWIVGYVSFLLGAGVNNLIPSRNKIINTYLDVHLLRKYLYAVLITYACLILISVDTYGGIPILKFITNEMNVNEMNDIQTQSGSSVFGLTFFFASLLLSCIAIATGFSVSNNKKLSFLIKLSVFALSFGYLMSGKRQGIMIMASVLIVSIILFVDKNSFPDIRNIIFSKLKIILLLVLIIAIVIFGVIGSIRTGLDFAGGFGQIFGYLELPIINLEWQISKFGLFIEQFNLYPLFAGLLPYKLIVDENSAQSFMEIVYGFSYPEAGIGSGIFGTTHLAFGLFAVLVYGFILGFIVNFIFQKAKYNSRWIVPYSFMVWPLLAAHSYNHFLNLLFFPLPFIFSILISRFVIKLK